jgi:transposase-like protein
MKNAITIQSIVASLECKPDLLVRVRCPFCDAGKTMILDPGNGRYECQACQKHGRLDDLDVYAQDDFDYRHRETSWIMRENGGVRQ